MQRERAIAISDNIPANKNHLRFQKGDVVTIVQKFPTGWWKGEANGETGIFPSMMVKMPQHGSLNTAERGDNERGRSSRRGESMQSRSRSIGRRSSKSRERKRRDKNKEKYDLAGERSAVFSNKRKKRRSINVTKRELAEQQQVIAREEKEKEERKKVVYATTLYPYKSNAKAQLSFEKGERLKVIEQRKNGWWTGENEAGTLGYIPASYVRIIKNPTLEQDERSTSSGSETASEASLDELVKAKVQYAYKARQDTELDLQPGQIVTVMKRHGNGWWSGTILGSNKIGNFPALYVRELSVQEAKDLSADEDSGSQSNGTGVSMPGKSEKKFPPFWTRAKYAYTARSKAEISFKKDDKVYVLKILERGWWRGDIDGNVGHFPGQYVEVLDENLPKPSVTPQRPAKKPSFKRCQSTGAIRVPPNKKTPAVPAKKSMPTRRPPATPPKRTDALKRRMSLPPKRVPPSRPKAPPPKTPRSVTAPKVPPKTHTRASSVPFKKHTREESLGPTPPEPMLSPARERPAPPMHPPPGASKPPARPTPAAPKLSTPPAKVVPATPKALPNTPTTPKAVSPKASSPVSSPAISARGSHLAALLASRRQQLSDTVDTDDGPDPDNDFAAPAVSPRRTPARPEPPKNTPPPARREAPKPREEKPQSPRGSPSVSRTAMLVPVLPAIQKKTEQQQRPKQTTQAKSNQSSPRSSGRTSPAPKSPTLTSATNGHAQKSQPNGHSHVDSKEITALQSSVQGNRNALVTLQQQTGKAVNSLRAQIQQQQQARTQLENVMRDMKRALVDERQARLQMAKENQQLKAEVAALKRQSTIGTDDNKVYTTSELTNLYQQTLAKLDSEVRVRRELQALVNGLQNQMDKFSKRFMDYKP